jgi:hypothetical protein
MAVGRYFENIPLKKIYQILMWDQNPRTEDGVIHEIHCQNILKRSQKIQPGDPPKENGSYWEEKNKAWQGLIFCILWVEDGECLKMA